MTPVLEALVIVSAIVGGEVDPGDLAVVHMPASNCSGTLVAPRAVLTAAHCGVSAGDPVSFSDGTTITALAFHPHPSWDPVAVRNDIAIIVLSEPSSITPLPLFAGPFDDALVGARVRIVGYGATGDGGAAGTKHTGFTTIASYEDTTFADSATPSASCAGDSGGPALLTVDGVEEIAGVTSRGDEGCLAFGEKTRADAYLASFVTPAIAAASSGATPSLGALGAPCEADGDCAGDLCAARSFGGARTCSALCDMTAASPCETGFACAAMDGSDESACFPSATPASAVAGAGGGCAIATRGDDASDFALPLVLLGLIARRRRDVGKSDVRR